MDLCTIRQIIKNDGTEISYTYDAAGNRISKTVANATSGNGQTWYVRDGSGNVMAVYTLNNPDVNWGNPTLTELGIYGSSRLGLYQPNYDMYNGSPEVTEMDNLGRVAYYTEFYRGKKLFELTNHLGNVMATVTDTKIPVAVAGNITYFKANVISAGEYAPFGMQLPGRTVSSVSYRYEFNGKEMDNETYGQGNVYDYGYRIYNPRIGRFLSVDPLTKNYPSWSPYPFAMNRPIDGVDLDGLEFYKTNDSYIRMQVNYDSKLGLMNSTQVFRHWEKQANGNYILPVILNERIDAAKTSPGIGSNASEITKINLYYEYIYSKRQVAIDPTDGASENLKPSEFKTLIIPRTKDEASKQAKTNQFYTQRVVIGNAKAEGIAAAIAVTGMMLEQVGENYVNNIIKTAKKEQTATATQVLKGIQSNLQLIPEADLNSNTVTKIANYLLFGAPITQEQHIDGIYPVDQKLTNIAKAIWESIKPLTTEQLKEKSLMDIKNNNTDNTNVSTTPPNQ